MVLRQAVWCVGNFIPEKKKSDTINNIKSVVNNGTLINIKIRLSRKINEWLFRIEHMLKQFGHKVAHQNHDDMKPDIIQKQLKHGNI